MRNDSRTLCLTVFVALLVAAPAVASLPIIRGAQAARRVLAAGGPQLSYLPSLHSRGYTTLTLRGASLAGMEGFGYSDVELQDVSGAGSDVSLRIVKDFEPDVVLKRRVPPRMPEVVRLKSERAITLGRYSAIVSASGPIGVRVRTSWVSGAAAAYEGPEAARKLILPLVARNIYSHTTIYMVQNTDDSPTPNEVLYEIFDNESGAPLVSITSMLDARSVAVYDTMFNESLFRAMPVNSGDGAIGVLRVTADKAVALMAYGDEMMGDGTSAYVARPVSAASRAQFLPVVRSNYLGDTLIAIANPSLSQGVDVAITYRTHSFSDGAGKGQQYAQQFNIVPRGAAFIDLAGLGRGNVDPPSVPRGQSRNRGFFGSAEIRASKPVLAVALEQVADGTRVRMAAAYNAFGTTDLARRFAVPVVRRAAGGRTTNVILMNPSDEPASVTLAYKSLADGQPLRSAAIVVPAHGTASVKPEGGVPALSHLAIESDRAVAVLVYDSTLLGRASWGRWGLDATVYKAIALRDDEAPTPGTGTLPPTPSTGTLPPTPVTGTITPKTATATRTPSPGATSPTPSPTWTLRHDTPSPTSSPRVTADLRYSAYLPVSFNEP